MSIKVLSYNTSWESSEPKPDWNNPNPYEPDAKDEQAKLDAMSIPERDKVKDDWIATNPTQPAWKVKFELMKKQPKPGAWISNWSDGEDGIGKMCGDSNDPTKVERCRNNIFSIIKDGNYDLVGMQEYIHTWKGKPVYSERMEQLEKEQNLKLVMNIEPITIPYGNKQIDIGSLYNTEKFDLLGQCSMELLQNDGRPVLVLHLKKKSDGGEILFINAHMPQPAAVPRMKGYSGDKIDDNAKAKVIGDTITNLITQKLPGVSTDNIRIIMVTDSNDMNDKYVKNIKILGKSLYHGKNYQKTCCTTLINDKKWTPSQYYKGPMMGATVGEEFTLTRKNRRIRYGDIILDSEKNLIEDAEYIYPEEKAGEPYSDHAPIAIELNEEVMVGGKRKSKRTKRMRRKTRRRTRRKTRKSKRRKSRKRKRRRTKRRKRGGEKFGCGMFEKDCKKARAGGLTPYCKYVKNKIVDKNCNVRNSEQARKNWKRATDTGCGFGNDPAALCKPEDPCDPSKKPEVCNDVVDCTMMYRDEWKKKKAENLVGTRHDDGTRKAGIQKTFRHFQEKSKQDVANWEKKCASGASSEAGPNCSAGKPTLCLTRAECTQKHGKAAYDNKLKEMNGDVRLANLYFNDNVEEDQIQKWNQNCSQGQLYESASGNMAMNLGGGRRRKKTRRKKKRRKKKTKRRR